jgi:hypothetical protein
MTAPSQSPVRLPSGVSTDQVWGPLANFGQPNPFMYQTLADDFFGLFTADGPWATLASGTGSSTANTDGDGGLLLLTNGTTVNLSSGLVGIKNSFFLPPQLYTGSGLTSTLYPSKKMFFMARMAIVNVTGFSATLGFTPKGYATGNPTDGIAIQIATNGTVCNLNAYSASVLQWSIPFPAALLAGGANAIIANNSWFDIGFYMDRQQNVYGMLGYPLFGWLPAQAWSGTNNVSAAPTPKAAVCAFQGVYNGQIVTPWTPSTAGLTPCIAAFGSGLTSQVDFVIAAKER